VKVTEHAKQQWIKRFNPESQDPEKEIEQAVAAAVEIYEEEDTGNKYESPARIMVKDNILCVCLKEEDVVVTVIDINFGFSPEINLEVCKMQTERILKVKEELSGLEEYVQMEAAKTEAKEFTISKCCDEKDALMKRLEAKRAEYIAETNKLRYSINYRLEMPGRKGNARKIAKSV